ncbi:MAG: hypothetical protein AAF658_07545, partial [Myxococcota bacterium]
MRRVFSAHLLGVLCLAIGCGGDDEAPRSETPPVVAPTDPPPEVILPGLATAPTPAPGASDVELSPTLAWTAGANVTAQNLYLGRSLAAVTTATPTSPEFVGSPSAGSQATGPLDAGATYYWRVSSEGGQPVVTLPGTIWSFQTAAPPMTALAAATAPSPADRALDVPPDTTLSWAMVTGATEYDVYLGSTLEEVAGAGRSDAAFVATTAETTASLVNALGFGETVFWRVDSRAGESVVAGPVWRFAVVVDNPPRFDGVRSVSAVGASAVRVTWDTALDDVTAGSALVYSVYVSTTAGGQDFTAAPAATVTGATERTLTASEFGNAAAGSLLYVVVRAADALGNQETNEVELAVELPVAANTRYVSAGAMSGGDGSLATPFNTIQAAIDALSPTGGSIIVASGTYNELLRFTATGLPRISVVGGFALAANADEATLLASRTPSSTLIDGSGLTPAQNEGVVHLANQGRPVRLDGLRFVNIPGYDSSMFSYETFRNSSSGTPPVIGAAITGIDANLELVSSVIQDADTSITPAFGIWVRGGGTARSRVSVLSSTIRDVPVALGLSGDVAKLSWRGNRVEETSAQIVDTTSSIVDGYIDETDGSRIIVPPNETLAVEVIDNFHFR